MGIQMLMFSRVNMSALKQVVLLTLVFSVASAPLKKRDEKLSEEARLQLKESVGRFVTDLYFSDNVSPQLKAGICKRISLYATHLKAQEAAAFKRASGGHLRSRC